MEPAAVIAITNNGIKIGARLKEAYPSWQVFAPEKLKDGTPGIEWFGESTRQKVGELFGTFRALVCIFSLGAVIRLVAPHIKDKKSDPAVMVIDDAANFVISVLSGHLGGANQMTSEIAGTLGSTPVITTAADVNKTIAVDLVGRDLGWRIDGDANVTGVSAMMVNGQKIGVYQDAGSPDWHGGRLPDNVTIYRTLAELDGSDSDGRLVISDRIIDERYLRDSVVYRPPTLVVGLGLHWDTTSEKILQGLRDSLARFSLAEKSILKIVTIKKRQDARGLDEAARELGVAVEYLQRDEIADVRVPNPSSTVMSFEGVPSVSEAAALASSGGELIVQKQKYPPDLTVAVARSLP